MNIKEYFEFVKWYFIYTNIDFDKHHDEYYKYYAKHPPVIDFSYNGTELLDHLSGTGRLVALIIVWIIIIAMTIALAFPIDMKIKYTFLGCIPLFWVTISPMACKFSFIYYAIIYPVYANRNRSLNDKVIFYEKMLGKTHEPVHKTIAKHYKVFRGKITYRYAEFHLVDKTKKNPPNNAKVYMSLRFTSKAVFFNGEKVFDGRMTDLSQLEECLENIIASGKGVPIQHKK